MIICREISPTVRCLCSLLAARQNIMQYGRKLNFSQ